VIEEFLENFLARITSRYALPSSCGRKKMDNPRCTNWMVYGPNGKSHFDPAEDFVKLLDASGALSTSS